MIRKMDESELNYRASLKYRDDSTVGCKELVVNEVVVFKTPESEDGDREIRRVSPYKSEAFGI